MARGTSAVPVEQPPSTPSESGARSPDDTLAPKLSFRQLSAADLDSMRQLKGFYGADNLPPDASSRELRAAEVALQWRIGKEERAAKASQELTAAQAQLVELSTAMAEKRP
ncbi:hypothetical protein AK812_SmicGene1222 [Symbiodinium microadriaticum]|uniref:Uncharacterized protein n=1 Tax=Symbiodinium microadriaticum TaxID=2951 RepID=A0A1Q9F4N3_SYMMI|nr:hypothetical protein AK812_SmicGene1222 [Symbiodinium microadriaticum]